jgi:hypothetical protein
MQMKQQPGVRTGTRWFVAAVLNPLLLPVALLIAAAAPLLASGPEGPSASTDGFAVGRGRAHVVSAPSQEVQGRVVRGDGTSAPSTDPFASNAPSPAGESARTPVPPSGGAKALDQPECTTCLEGSASAQWTGSTGSFHVDHIVNHRSSTTGPMDLKLILTATLPVWGQPFSYLSFSDSLSLSPLAGGHQYDSVDSGTVNVYAGSMPAGTYYQLLYLRENVSGFWFIDDFIVFPKQVACDGFGCSPIAGCTPDAFTACLIGSRYRVTSHWRNQYNGSQVNTLAAAPLTDATAAFWLTSADIYEYLIRINTATDNGRAWISIPTFTDVEFWIAVQDTVNGQYYEYHSAPGNRTLIYDPYFFVYP